MSTHCTCHAGSDQVLCSLSGIRLKGVWLLHVGEAICVSLLRFLNRVRAKPNDRPARVFVNINQLRDMCLTNHNGTGDRIDGSLGAFTTSSVVRVKWSRPLSESNGAIRLTDFPETECIPEF